MGRDGKICQRHCEPPLPLLVLLLLLLAQLLLSLLSLMPPSSRRCWSRRRCCCGLSPQPHPAGPVFLQLASQLPDHAVGVEHAESGAGAASAGSRAEGMRKRNPMRGSRLELRLGCLSPSFSSASCWSRSCSTLASASRSISRRLASFSRCFSASSRRTSASFSCSLGTWWALVRARSAGGGRSLVSTARYRHLPGYSGPARRGPPRASPPSSSGTVRWRPPRRP